MDAFLRGSTDVLFRLCVPENVSEYEPGNPEEQEHKEEIPGPGEKRAGGGGQDHFQGFISACLRGNL
jgi:hypothetical protein